MPEVVGVRFKKRGKVYYFDPIDLELPSGAEVIVETSRGLELGQVVIPRRSVAEAEVSPPLKKVLRLATCQDAERLEENRRLEAQARGLCQRKIAERNLPMKLVDVQQAFDRSKIVFFFTADTRVDFRDLVKDLATALHTRIDLRQIGVRDEARMIGGMGTCGRELCCASFLDDFDPVSIRMAKDQNLSLNPTKISGMCGRLMCCLRYENESYERARSCFPGCGCRVKTPEGDGKVVGNNYLKDVVSVEFPDKHQAQFPLESVDWKRG